MSKILIKSGTIITASETFVADILVDGEKIAAIGQGLDISDAEIVDASGKIVLPGGVDPHTHFDLPMFGTVSSDDHYTGHKAAAFGGTTTVIDFVSQDFPSLQESVDAWHIKADEKAAVDFSFHMNISTYPQSIVNELTHLLNMGITSLKVFMAYNNRLRLDD
jgi:dihydropyrimidinase